MSRLAILPLLTGLMFAAHGMTRSIAQQPPDAAPPPHVLQSPASPGAPGPPPVVPAEQVAPAELTGLLGHPVANAEGKDLARVVDLLVDGQGQARAAVLDVGGFLGVGSRKVAVAWSALRFASGAKEPVISVTIPLDRIRSWAEYIPGRPVAILGAQSQPVNPPAGGQADGQPDTAGH